MSGPDVCRGPCDVCRRVKRYSNGSVKQPMRGAQGSAPPPPPPPPFLLALPVPVLLLLELPVPDDPCFNSRVPRAGAIRLKYPLCIVLLLILFLLP